MTKERCVELIKSRLKDRGIRWETCFKDLSEKDALKLSLHSLERIAKYYNTGKIKDFKEISITQAEKKEIVSTINETAGGLDREDKRILYKLRVAMLRREKWDAEEKKGGRL